MVYLVEIEMTTQWIDQWINELKPRKIQSVKSRLETLTINLETLTIKLSFACMFQYQTIFSKCIVFPIFHCFQTKLVVSNLTWRYQLYLFCFQTWG